MIYMYVYKCICGKNMAKVEASHGVSNMELINMIEEIILQAQISFPSYVLVMYP